ncbi:MAG TPA: hypothetical protein VIH90_04920 [Candidatus Saccharimonadales bacterium]
MSLLKKKQQIRTRNRAPEEASKKVSAYTYHNSRSELDEVEERDIRRSTPQSQNKDFWLSRFGFIILIIVSVVCLFNILQLSSKPKITYLGNSTNSTLYKLYEPAFVLNSSKLFNESLLNHNKITVNTKHITDVLESEFPEFSNISITLPLINHNPIIYLTPATPAAILENPSGQYLISQQGTAMLFGYKDANGFSYLNLPIITDQSGIEIKLGKPALTSQNISFIQTISAQLAARQDTVTAMTLPSNSSEIDVNLSGKPYYVKFNLEDNNPKLEAGSFLATESYLKGHNITPSKYVDVRAQGRVYYQ